jgi:monofunctional biosynthetic peptidoglycan transglycosylase
MQKRGWKQYRLNGIAGFFWKSAAVVLLTSFAAMLLLRWWSPPASAFMTWQRLAGIPIDYRWVPLERISPYAALAVVASEDQNFFDHHGFDFDAIADAIKDNRSRKRPRGASTISQQVAKNLFLWPDPDYFRKGLEAYLTLLMELVWSKHRILEVYLNIAEMGRGVYGVEAASRRFFGKPAARLTMHEAATLAAVLPNPKQMSAARPSDYVRDRTWQIIEQMHALGGKRWIQATAY